MANKKIGTWLPVFPGFYNTVFEPDHDQEIESINERRAENGLDEISWDDCEWDNEYYETNVCQRAVEKLGKRLVELGFVTGFTYEKIISPKEYNFKNDAVDIIVELSKKNIDKIETFLKENAEAYDKYLDRYTSRSGFISSYPDTIEEFSGTTRKELVEALEHNHKLGSILDFICIVNEIDYMWLYYEVSTSDFVHAENYDKLVDGIEPAKEDVEIEDGV